MTTKDSDESCRACEERERRRGGPPVCGRARHRVDQHHQTGGDGGSAGKVEVTVREVGTALLQQQRRQRDCGDADGHVDEEDPGPAQVRRQDAPEQDAGGGAAAGRSAVDAQREIALTAFRERRHQQRECGRSEQRPTEALHRPEGDQRALRPGEPAQERAHGEEREPEHEQPAASEEIRQTAAQEQRAPEEDGVGRDHPLEVGLREPEIRLDRGQGDVHDRDVENDHELRGDDQREGAPAPVRLRRNTH